MKQRLPIALTIAGSDSGGGAGVQADLKTFAALGVYGASVVTALTAQNTRGVRAIHYPPLGIVSAQIEAVLEDFAVAAIKIGMLGSAEIANVVAEALFPLGEDGPDYRVKAFVVYDPVMVASSGDPLSGAGFGAATRQALLPLVDCLTPNLAEAATLLGEPIAKSEADMTRQSHALLKLGPRAVLMKGGHLDGDEAVDLLVTEEAVRRFAAPRLASRNLHGTGCTLSSAIAANIVLGAQLPEAVAGAKVFVREAIERGRDIALGAGAGPLIQTELRSKL
ncbi:MAG TPA: bifunctional hydroxymethylpyrimidine kinase/phosphomethylpyrimidine kinase [Roseiarcus sp.]